VNRREFNLLSTTAALAGLGLASGARAETPTLKLSAEEAYKLAATGSGFTVGPMMAANTVYVFFDTTCPHCAHLWQSAEPLRTKLKMVWMPVGLLRPQSSKQGATILSAADPVAAMTQNETRLMNRQGGIEVPANLSDAVLAKVKANTTIFTDKLGANSVPLVLLRNAHSGNYVAHSGAAETAQLAAMVGL
jgi:thiol:disulfide interchange protein DsbG